MRVSRVRLNINKLNCHLNQTIYFVFAALTKCQFGLYYTYFIFFINFDGTIRSPTRERKKKNYLVGHALSPE